MALDDLIQGIKKLGIVNKRDYPSTPKAHSKPWNKSHLKTGLIYHDFMGSHKCLWTKSDECPERYECVRDRFKHYNLIDKCQVLEPQIATKDDVLLCHDEKYYELVESTQGSTDIEQLKRISERFDGIYFNEHTYDAAMMAVGSSIRLTDAVLDQEEIKNGFALVRPPGHHAQKGEANGFCFFNNAAIAAKHCVQVRKLKRVLVVDWDVHHGQGTQSFFYDDPNVMYISIHRYEKGRYWPELIESNFNFTGSGPGKGYNINLPLNDIGCNDGDFLLMWFNVILPIAYQFCPEIVIVSAGFDAAIGCPEGKMRVKPQTYQILCHSLMALADGKIVVLFEGGYNLLSLAEGAAMTLRALLNYPQPQMSFDIIELNIHKSVVQTVLDAIWALRSKWKILCLQGKFQRFKADQSASSPGGDIDLRPKYSPVATYEGTASDPDKKPEKYDLEGVCCPKNDEEQAALREEILSIIDKTDLSSPKFAFQKRTLLMFDDTVVQHKCQISHPEKPARYTRIKDKLIQTNLLQRCSTEPSRKATEDEILSVHDATLLELLKRTQSMSSSELLKTGNQMDSIFLNKSTYDCALLAAGCAMEAVDKVMQGIYTNAFALIRPPGHHANGEMSSGFCIFNNIMIAARFAQRKYKEKCKRILIVDYDFHHGNGTQELIGEDEEEILFISLHAYNDCSEYPADQSGNFTSGRKNVVNIPWNDDRMGDSEYLAAFLSIVLPCAYEFNPDLVLVSSGFDAAVNDPLGSYRVTPAAYGHLVHHLMPLARGRVVALLEGGYNLDSISEAAAHVVSVLLGDPAESLGSLGAPNAASVLSMKNVISYHKSNYKMLCLDYDLPSDELED